MAQRSGGGVWLLAAAVFAGLYLTRDTILNQPAPAFSLLEASGRRASLESYRGRPVLLVFWTTSCGICRRELPMLSRLAPEFQRKRIEILPIHLGDADAAGDYLRSNHIDLRSVVDTEGTVGHAYHVSGVPKLILIGNDGKIKKTTVGAVDERTLLEWADAASGA